MSKPKGKPPAFQFYANDFMDATKFMDANAVGLYIRCLCTQWTHGALPSDLKVLARGMGMEHSEVLECWTALACKYVDAGDGTMYNVRLEQIRERQEEISGKRAVAATVRWTDANADANAHAKNKQRKVKEKEKIESEEEGEQEVEISVMPWPTFEDWWTAYAKKIDRPKCEAKWKHLSQADRETAMRHTEAYVIATPDIQFRRNPATYLNNHNYQDEQLTEAPKPQRATSGIEKHEQDRQEVSRIIAERSKAGIFGAF